MIRGKTAERVIVDDPIGVTRVPLSYGLVALLSEDPIDIQTSPVKEHHPNPTDRKYLAGKP